MKSLEELQALRDKFKGSVSLREDDDHRIRIVVGMATCGIAAGARPVLTAFTKEIATRKLHDVSITQTGCIGICQHEPVVEIYETGKEKVTYIKVSPEKVARIVAEHIVNGNIVPEFTVGSIR